MANKAFGFGEAIKRKAMSVETNVSVYCALCGANEPQTLHAPPRAPGPVVRCQNCGLVYVSPRVRTKALIDSGPVGEPPEHIRSSSDLADIEGSWELPLLEAKEKEQAALRRNALLALERLAQFVTPPGHLLDFGCGGGFFLEVAGDLGWKIHGLEPLPAHAVYARVRSGAQIVNDTLRQNTFPPSSFDAITAFQVFEHLPDPAADLKRLARMLRPGGAILIEVPNIETWSVRLLGPRHRHFVQDHLYFFSEDTLSRMLTTSGFEVADVYHPTRWMTIRHLLDTWGGRVLPSGPARWLAILSRGLTLSDKLIPINVGDIIAVIGRKRRD